MNEEVEKARQKIMEYLPHSIDVMKEIISDKTTSPKTAIQASNALCRLESTLKKMQKEFNSNKE